MLASMGGNLCVGRVVHRLNADDAGFHAAVVVVDVLDKLVFGVRRSQDEDLFGALEVLRNSVIIMLILGAMPGGRRACVAVELRVCVRGFDGLLREAIGGEVENPRLVVVDPNGYMTACHKPPLGNRRAGRKTPRILRGHPKQASIDVQRLRLDARFASVRNARDTRFG